MESVLRVSATPVAWYLRPTNDIIKDISVSWADVPTANFEPPASYGMPVATGRRTTRRGESGAALHRLASRPLVAVCP